jgi:hypothetical protein
VTRPYRVLVLIPALAVLAFAAGVVAAPSRPVATFGAPTLLDGSGKTFTEPRVAFRRDGTRYVITSMGTGEAIVFSSRNGADWDQIPSPAGQTSPSPDTDIVVTRTGRIIASELEGLPTTSILTAYSDDKGHTWHQSTGMVPIDTDRQWFAVGRDDPATHLPRVYLLWHNLFSGLATHNMYVQTSTDNGATFGAPIPVTLPGSQAFLDLQCGDSGGPSGIVVSPKSGSVIVSFGTRSADAGGGCGASVTGDTEVNIVAATRHWVASSPDGSLGSWKLSLAVDDSKSKHIVAGQLAGLAVDRAGNVYVAYPEAGAAGTIGNSAVRYVWAKPDLNRWSRPVTVERASPAGHLLVHIVAGDPGRLMLAYMAGVDTLRGPQWYSVAAAVNGGLGSSPKIRTVKLMSDPAFLGQADELEGRCGFGPTAGIQNGVICSRIPDVYGMAVAPNGLVTIAWPASKDAGGPGGTYVSTETKGFSLYARGR